MARVSYSSPAAAALDRGVRAGDQDDQHDHHRHVVEDQAEEGVDVASPGPGVTDHRFLPDCSAEAGADVSGDPDQGMVGRDQSLLAGDAGQVNVGDRAPL